MTEYRIENVSDTAFWVAHYRELETERADALFRDPLAGMLAGERGKAIAESMPMAAIIRWMIPVRTRLTDDHIENAVARGVDAVLNLGAGLDARPYRLNLPDSLLWVEADYAAMIDFKEQRLANEKPRCRLERVRIDLGDSAARRAMLAAVDGRAKKLLVLSEGVTPYLTVEQVGSLADDLRSLSHLSAWVLDYRSSHAARWTLRIRAKKQMVHAPVRFLPEDWFAFFRMHGWRPKTIYYYMPEGRRLGRPIQLPVFLGLIVKVVLPFITAKKRAEMTEIMGMAVLEPEVGPA